MTAPLVLRHEGAKLRTLDQPSESGPALTVEVAETLEALQCLQPDYEHLQSVTGNTLPFALHEWHVAWCRQFLNIHKHVDTRMMIHVVRDPDGACVGVVPLLKTRRGIGPLRFTSIDLLGTDPGVTEIRAPLIASGYERRVAFAIEQSIRATGRPHWVQWDGITPELSAALADRATLRWQAPLLDYILDLPPSWEELRQRLKRNIRESIRHCYNSLKRDSLQPELHIAREPHEVRTSLESCFLRLHALRAARADTIRHRDVFASAAARGFLLDVTEQLSQRGMVRVFELRLNGEAVATRIGFVVGKSLYLYYSGYDPAWSKYGVMTTTVVEAIKHAIASGLTTVNLSPGTDVSKTRWAPRVVQYPQAAEVFPSLIARVAWGTYKRARANDVAGVGSPVGLARLIKRAWV